MTAESRVAMLTEAVRRLCQVSRRQNDLARFQHEFIERMREELPEERQAEVALVLEATTKSIDGIVELLDKILKETETLVGGS